MLVHYSDLLRDLEGEMHRLANILAIKIPEETWPALDAARFVSMRKQADRLVPSGDTGVPKDVHAFFRTGSSGAWRHLLTDEDVARYEQRVASLAPPELLDWLHR